MTVALLRHLGAGLGLGLVTGAVARGFMALLTNDPQFSWAGTAFILGVFAVAGLALAAAHVARTRRGSRWWKLLALPSVLIFLGPGLLLVPAVLALSLVVSRRRWMRAAGGAVLVGSVALLAVLGETADEPFTLRTAAGFVVMYAVCAAVAAGARAALTGWEPVAQARDRRPRPSPTEATAPTAAATAAPRKTHSTWTIAASRRAWASVWSGSAATAA